MPAVKARPGEGDREAGARGSAREADRAMLPSPEVREDLLGELSALYGELDRDIAALRPTCRQSGDCCRFDSYGHKLYATRAEAVYFALRRGWPALRRARLSLRAHSGGKPREGEREGDCNSTDQSRFHCAAGPCCDPNMP